MANLIIQENGKERTTPAVHGEEITIQTPCDCSAVTGVQIAGVEYPFYDAAGKVLPTGTGLFAEGSLIRVLIDTVNGKANIINHAITPESVGTTQIATGSYVGTGKYGSANRNSITFSFVPKFLFVIRDNRYIAVTSASHTQNDMVWIEGMVKDRDNNLEEEYRRYSRTNNTVYWYSETSEDDQMNTSGTKYFYFAIG